VSIAFDRPYKTPTSGRWYFLKDDSIPTGQVRVEWHSTMGTGPYSPNEYDVGHGEIRMNVGTGSQVGQEDLRQIATAQRQAIETKAPCLVVAYDRTGLTDPIRQTITMMKDTLHAIGKNGGKIDPLSFSASQQSMSRLRTLMDEANETYNLLAEAYMDGDT